MMVEQTKTKESLGAYWKGNNWLFTQSDGSMMSYSTPYATFQDAIDRYNANKEPSDQLPHIPFHGLRHTSATLLIAAHQDVRTVSNRLGHAQASTTMNIYAHALKEIAQHPTPLKICSAKPEHKYSGIKQSRSDFMSYLLCFMVEALKPAFHHRK